ncbi:MAG: hypothetical protein WCZ71_05080 [Proteiniphilum sp.]|nr:hypothetical protein [Proteiniphilum sp.]MDD5346062.1 hypothetical protein [Proteiniphilum sp.]MDD5620055.1 hypothetical protein [Proteiniphilum sp.]MDY0182318.1 hypothetical protein [Proteiniphilum sp.]
MKTQLIPLRVTLPTFILPGLLRNTSVSPFRVVSFVRIDSGMLPASMVWPPSLMGNLR